MGNRSGERHSKNCCSGDFQIGSKGTGAKLGPASVIAVSGSGRCSFSLSALKNVCEKIIVGRSPGLNVLLGTAARRSLVSRSALLPLFEGRCESEIFAGFLRVRPIPSGSSSACC